MSSPLLQRAVDTVRRGLEGAIDSGDIVYQRQAVHAAVQLAQTACSTRGEGDHVVLQLLSLLAGDTVNRVLEPTHASASAFDLKDDDTLQLAYSSGLPSPNFQKRSFGVLVECARALLTICKQAPNLAPPKDIVIRILGIFSAVGKKAESQEQESTFYQDRNRSKLSAEVIGSLKSSVSSLVEIFIDAVDCCSDDFIETTLASMTFNQFSKFPFMGESLIIGLLGRSLPQSKDASSLKTFRRLILKELFLSPREANYSLQVFCFGELRNCSDISSDFGFVQYCLQVLNWFASLKSPSQTAHLIDSLLFTVLNLHMNSNELVLQALNLCHFFVDRGYVLIRTNKSIATVLSNTKLVEMEFLLSISFLCHKVHRNSDAMDSEHCIAVNLNLLLKILQSMNSVDRVVASSISFLCLSLSLSFSSEISATANSLLDIIKSLPQRGGFVSQRRFPVEFTLSCLTSQHIDAMPKTPSFARIGTSAIEVFSLGSMLCGDLDAKTQSELIKKSLASGKGVMYLLHPALISIASNSDSFDLVTESLHAMIPMVSQHKNSSLSSFLASSVLNIALSLCDDSRPAMRGLGTRLIGKLAVCSAGSRVRNAFWSFVDSKFRELSDSVFRLNDLPIEQCLAVLVSIRELCATVPNEGLEFLAHLDQTTGHQQPILKSLAVDCFDELVSGEAVEYSTVLNRPNVNGLVLSGKFPCGARFLGNQLLNSLDEGVFRVLLQTSLKDDVTVEFQAQGFDLMSQYLQVALKSPHDLKAELFPNQLLELSEVQTKQKLLSFIRLARHSVVVPAARLLKLIIWVELLSDSNSAPASIPSEDEKKSDKTPSFAIKVRNSLFRIGTAFPHLFAETIRPAMKRSLGASLLIVSPDSDCLTLLPQLIELVEVQSKQVGTLLLFPSVVSLWSNFVHRLVQFEIRKLLSKAEAGSSEEEAFNLLCEKLFAQVDEIAKTSNSSLVKSNIHLFKSVLAVESVTVYHNYEKLMYMWNQSFDAVSGKSVDLKHILSFSFLSSNLHATDDVHVESTFESLKKVVDISDNTTLKAGALWGLANLVGGFNLQSASTQSSKVLSTGTRWKIQREVLEILVKSFFNKGSLDLFVDRSEFKSNVTDDRVLPLTNGDLSAIALMSLRPVLDSLATCEYLDAVANVHTILSKLLQQWKGDWDLQVSCSLHLTHAYCVHLLVSNRVAPPSLLQVSFKNVVKAIGSGGSPDATKMGRIFAACLFSRVSAKSSIPSVSANILSLIDVLSDLMNAELDSESLLFLLLGIDIMFGEILHGISGPSLIASIHLASGTDSQPLKDRLHSFIDQLALFWTNVANGSFSDVLDVQLVSCTLFAFSSSLNRLNEESKNSVTQASQVIQQGSIIDECVKAVNQASLDPENLALLEASLLALDLGTSPKPQFLKERRNSALVKSGRKSSFKALSINSSSLKKIMESGSISIQLSALKLLFFLVDDGDSSCSKLLESLFSSESLSFWISCILFLETLFKDGLILVRNLPAKKVISILDTCFSIVFASSRDPGFARLQVSLLIGVGTLIDHYSATTSRVEETSKVTMHLQNLLNGVIFNWMSQQDLLNSNHFQCMERGSTCNLCSVLQNLARCCFRFVSAKTPISLVFPLTSTKHCWKFVVLRSMLFPELGISDMDLRACFKFLALEHSFEGIEEVHLLSSLLFCSLSRISQISSRLDWVINLLDFILLCLKNNNILATQLFSNILSLLLTSWEAPTLVHYADFCEQGNIERLHSLAGYYSQRIFEFSDALRRIRMFNVLVDIVAVAPRSPVWRFCVEALRYFPLSHWEGFEAQWTRLISKLPFIE
jgi:hypothetical protein